MSRLFDAYRATHEQGFVPIFVTDGTGCTFDSKVLVEGCVKAGMKTIEYTLRRQDAKEMIPWTRKNYPDLYLLVGSNLDSDKITNYCKKKFPQLMTIDEIAGIGVDGFVSMLGWSLETIRKYADTHIIMPTAMTVTEALQQIDAGAHFAKMLGSDLNFVKRCRLGAAFDYCPIIVTGGMILETIESGVAAGATLIATGLDLSLKGRSPDITSDEVAEVMKEYMSAVKDARAKYYPQLAKAEGKDKQTWLDALPHYHPF
jgi:2-keto-3-deoxy-6-phosphogluconate aldolase